MFALLARTGNIKLLSGGDLMMKGFSSAFAGLVLVMFSKIGFPRMHH